VFLVNDNGTIHFFRAHDREVARALRHNPSSVMSGMDWFRRMMQQTYTSSALAPWFAWRALRNELGVIRAVLPAEYTAGYLHKALKSGVANTSLYDKAVTQLPDPTFNLRIMSATGQGIKARAIKRWADFLSRQLAQNSTVIKAFGEPRIRATAEAMIRAYNDTLTATMTRRGLIDNLHVMERQASIFHDIDKVQNWARTFNAATVGVPRTVFDAVRTALGHYVDFADSLRNGPRIALYAEQLEGLLQKYKGNIPQEEIKKLNRTVQHITGDITRGIGFKGLATALSVTPYGVNTLNSTMHILEAFAHNKGYIGTRILTNMVLPKIAWRLALSILIGEEFERWYSDDIPLWQRQSNIPMLSPAYFMEMMKSGPRKPTINDVMLMPQEPEGILLSEVASTAFQSLGFFGAHAKDTATGWDIADAFGTMMNVNVPLLDIFEAINGKSERAKFERETLAGPSEPKQRMIDAAHAVLGGVFDLVGNAAQAGSDTLHRGSGIADAIQNAFGYGLETLKQKVPETPLTSLFGGHRRHYTKTQIRERNQSKFKSIRAVDDMLSQMRRAGGPGMLQRPMIRDPQALRMAQMLHVYANSGPMRVLKKRRSMLYGQIDVLDANMDKLAPGEYTRRTEELKRQITAVDHQEDAVFNKLDMQLQGVGGIDGALEYIKKSVQP
jgi:hypothetical protein